MSCVPFGAWKRARAMDGQTYRPPQIAPEPKPHDPPRAPTPPAAPPRPTSDEPTARPDDQIRRVPLASPDRVGAGFRVAGRSGAPAGGAVVPVGEEGADGGG